MSVEIGTLDEDLASEVPDDATIVHSHSARGKYSLVWLFNDPDQIDVGGPFGCPFCDLEVNYPENFEEGYLYFYDVNREMYVCSRCKWENENEASVKTHFTKVHGKNETDTEENNNGDE